MRSTILELLRNTAGKYISGEEIAKKLQVSRTAVWKHIRELKQAGYAIESHSRKGYALLDAPDLLLPNEIKNNLKSKLLGQQIEYEEEVGSTNNEAKILAANGVKDGTIVVSEMQKNGRGRISRGWFSPYGKGIWCSVILKPNFLPQDAPKCTLMAAVAVTKAIYNITNVKVGIKWPNDILYNGKKLVGILTEMNAEMDRINYIVIGMGINVNLDEKDFPDELQEIATSLSTIKEEKISRVKLLCEILKQLEKLYQEAMEKGFTEILTEWKKYSITLGQHVNVIGLNHTFDGIAVDIDKDGALLVKTDKEIKTVLAGDVSIRPKL